MPAVSYSPRFIKALKALSGLAQDKAIRSLTLFMTHPESNSLRFRRLSGVADHFIISTNRGDRIILKKVGENDYEAVDVGPHDMYRSWNR